MSASRALFFLYACAGSVGSNQSQWSAGGLAGRPFPPRDCRTDALVGFRATSRWPPSEDLFSVFFFLPPPWCPLCLVVVQGQSKKSGRRTAKRERQKIKKGDSMREQKTERAPVTYKSAASLPTAIPTMYFLGVKKRNNVSSVEFCESTCALSLPPLFFVPFFCARRSQVATRIIGPPFKECGGWGRGREGWRGARRCGVTSEYRGGDAAPGPAARRRPHRRDIHSVARATRRPSCCRRPGPRQRPA